MNSTTADARQRSKATTADILGTHASSPTIESRWQKHFKRLLAAREAMTRHKGGLVETAKEDLPRFSLHIGDAGSDQYEQDFTLSMISADQATLYEIEAALNRIREGTYGTCELTGRPIEPERLDAIPWTRYSAAAQKELENEGRASRIHFAKRRTLNDSEPVEDSEDEAEEAA